MGKPTAAVRAAGWVTVGVVAAGGIAAAATTSDSGSGSGASQTAATAPATTGANNNGAVKGSGKGRGGGLAKLRGRLLHGQFTVLGKDGKPEVYAEQRGTVASVTPSSITLVTAKDNNFTQQYVIDDKTRVRIDGKKATVGDVKSGQEAAVLAAVENGKQTAKLIIERPQK